jgi:hypothetical protein
VSADSGNSRRSSSGAYYSTPVPDASTRESHKITFYSKSSRALVLVCECVIFQCFIEVILTEQILWPGLPVRADFFNVKLPGQVAWAVLACRR